MLATRSFRMAATRYYNPAVYAWSVKTQTPLKMQQTTTWYTTPIAAAYSNDAKSGDPSTKSKVPSPPPSLSSSSASPGKSTSSMSSTLSPSRRTSFGTDNCSSNKLSSSIGPLSKTDVKLPSREQVESAFFKSVVFIWDCAFYVFLLSCKLFETYVVKNATVQKYWNLLLKRMDDARKESK